MPDPAHDEDAVRRLLGEARHDEAVPPEVAARLDTLLGQLVEARSAVDRPRASVHPLEARRRSRRGLLLVAAAAAAVGILVPTLDQLGSREDSTTAADSAASRAEPSSAASSESSGDTASEDTARPAAPQAVAGAVELTRAGFDSEVRRAEQGRSLARPGSAGVCAADPGAGYGEGTIVAAAYDGTPAVLVYRPSAGGSQRVDLLACGSAAVIRTTTVPASP